jgi:hypothetical protein
MARFFSDETGSPGESLPAARCHPNDSLSILTAFSSDIIGTNITGEDGLQMVYKLKT